MEFIAARPVDRVQGHPRNYPHIMSMVMPQPPAHHFRRDYGWEESRYPDYHTLRPREAEKIHLPSIRQTFATELQLRINPVETAYKRAPSSTTSPGVVFSAGTMTSPDYVHSPNQNKRRRVSIGDECEERASQVPRLYTSPRDDHRAAARSVSPPTYPPPRSTTDSWGGSTHTSPYMPHAGSLPSMRSPVSREAQFHERTEPRLTLPSLPRLNLERHPPMPRIRGHASDDGYTDRHMLHHGGPSPMEDRSSPAYRHDVGGYFTYQQHPSRSQSLSLNSHHYDHQIPFSPGPYVLPQYTDYMRYPELGLSGELKTRKRRGNLPKETTDKLRSWFVAHLDHPYPSEDEKQELMRQTNLQMNQISNWFINARRRQLPMLLNSAQVISTARNADVKILPSTERTEYDPPKQSSVPLSDAEASPDVEDGYYSRCRAAT